MNTKTFTHSLTSRREFLKSSGKSVAGAALAIAIPRPGYCAENNTIKVALIGCGGRRGTAAAAQALATAGPTQLWAMADVLPDRLQDSHSQLNQRFTSQFFVPPERQFFGFDAFKHAIDSLDKGSVVLLCTPPAFRPTHLEYAVEKGMHVFMEKSFAVDAPGIHRVLKTGQEAARKNLKIAGGLMSRHYRPLEEAVAQIHNGATGDVMHDAKGSAVLGEGQSKPRLFKGHRQTNENVLWNYEGPPCHQYQVEHDRLFAAIREDRPYIETERCAKSCLTAIMGRMACESGQLVTWDTALASDLQPAPGLEILSSLDATESVSPDAQGGYPIAKPGVTNPFL